MIKWQKQPFVAYTLHYSGMFFLNPNSILHISLTVSNFSHHLVLDNLRYGTHITFLCVNKSSTIAGSLVTFVSSDVLLDGNFTTGVAWWEGCSGALLVASPSKVWFFPSLNDVPEKRNQEAIVHQGCSWDWVGAVTNCIMGLIGGRAIPFFHWGA